MTKSMCFDQVALQNKNNPRYFDREQMKLGHQQFSVAEPSGSVMQVRVLLDPLQKKRLGTVLMEAKLQEQRVF
jgi:hypothetical protein